jgi:HIV Tat-specific factor 1
MTLPPTRAPAVPTAGFTDDDRVYFSKETETWRYENDDGAEMEYDPAKSSWVPVVSIIPNCLTFYT